MDKLFKWLRDEFGKTEPKRMHADLDIQLRDSVFRGDFTTAEYLITEKGAKPGRDLLAYTVQAGWTNLSELLINNGSKPNGAMLDTAMRRDDAAMTSLLLQKGVHVTADHTEYAEQYGRDEIKSMIDKRDEPSRTAPTGPPYGWI